LNLRKAFENQKDRLLPAFKIRELALASFQNRQVGSGCLSKSASWLWPVFKTAELALAGFPKLSAQLREICYPKGAKYLNSPVLKSFSQIQKVFALNGKEFINSI
jgi:hypothetical protein